ncbi:hypothetical protein TBLA_0A04840 [Henningerozyma blattae CBS 6284]|uniref:Acireductone dioxygenase n=1 Tax=Henningerozyma blattae (strain ATCC 34711 / CBS 6284 / DSM 70876 / NBRC 10599 / NRRL Y-10934 / UCD 77-7) TaxID=1071380 RepID=I2GVX5_HENB6|nr:hypothetical protein TBLA_0A04840 [Tetrapisispora blattae CBS 6284]CCH58277.1 hypothetical protein TBLA_0A04840 [Tetrapisispora blattae CBS 6284]
MSLLRVCSRVQLPVQHNLRFLAAGNSRLFYSVLSNSKIYFYDNDYSVDFREPHESGRKADVSDLKKIGVEYYHMPKLEDVNKFAKNRAYKNRDTIELNLKTFKNDEKALVSQLNIFFDEHLHEDEEIRYCLEGDGYFDFRSNKNDWIRCKVEKGDFLVVPAGIYHRFTLTSSNHIKALRLFKDQPKWLAIERTKGDLTPIRKQYLETFNL